MNENEIGGIVVDCAVKMPMRLGPGLLETVYEAVLSYEGRYLPYHKWQTGMTSLFFSVSPCEAILSCRVMGNDMPLRRYRRGNRSS
jgi:hypothetical protein